jgi:hypothetical protein
MKKMAVFGLLAVTGLYATAPMREGAYPRPINPTSMFADTTDPLKLRFNYLYEFAEIAEFCASWQLDDPDSADHGGMIEAESGELWDVIQTDNTQEAIWVWTRYGQLTGDTARFKENIEKAWGYCERFPAWEEEGSAGDDYYRAHNCAWGIAAEQCYREVYEDQSWTWYRDSCAEFIKTHPLGMLWDIDRFVKGWCAGWLYSYGVEIDDTEARDSACSIAEALLEWIDGMTPQYTLTQESWAMSAGTIVWGICNSAFQADTLRGKAWIEENGKYLDTFQVWEDIDYYSWDNAWNVGYANGHGAMYDISRDPQYARHHRWLTHKLLSYDTDSDGGIMATTQDADTTDMTWVSLYLAMMGLDRLIGEVHDQDVGPLEIVGISDGDQIEPGTKVDIVAVVTNYGRALLSNVNVTLSGDASGSGNSTLDFLGMDTLTLVSGWTVSDSAVLVLTASHSQDQNKANDTLVVRLNKAAGIGIREDTHQESGLHLEVATLNNSLCKVRYALPAGKQGQLALYNVAGSRINSHALKETEDTLEWNLTGLASGVYFVQLNAAGRTLTARLVFLR